LAVLLVAAPAFAASEVEFAGEPVPLSRPEAAEGLDQELLLLSEAKSRVWLTLRRSERYLPIIEAALTNARVHQDFKYLPMALASLAPAYQAQGRAGLWRLTQADAKGMGLAITSELDERLDPVAASSQAAVKIAALVKAYGSNVLALAAFIDEGAVKTAQAVGGKDKNFFQLYLPESLEKLVYQVIAGKILFGGPEAYGYRKGRFWPVLARRREKQDRPVNLKELAKRSDVDYKTFRDMNPHILGDEAPAGAYLYLP
jgi:hypothetical protein